LTLEKYGYDLLPEQATIWLNKLEKVKKENWIGQKVDVTTWKDEMQDFMWLANMVRYFGYLFGIIIGLITIVSILNTAWMSIIERKKEIATLRTIGLRKSGIIFLVAIEFVMLAFSFSLLGYITYLSIAALSSIYPMSVPKELVQFVLSETFVITTDFLSSFWIIIITPIVVAIVSILPTIIVAKIKPAIAMAE